MMFDQEILDVFKNEVREILENIEEDLVALEDKADSETVNRLFRYYHTIKGSSGIAGLDSVSEFTHNLENLLDMVRNGSLAVSSGLVDLLLESSDWIHQCVFENSENDAIRTILLQKIGKFRNTGGSVAEQKQPAVKSGFSYYRIKIGFRNDIFNFGIDPLLIIEDLMTAGEILESRVIRDKIPTLSEINPELCYLSWSIVLKTDKGRRSMDDVFLFVLDDNPIEIIEITGEYEENVEESTQEKKLGEILVNKGILTEQELVKVLKEQERLKSKLGDIVVTLGYATEKELKLALGIQNEIRKKVETETVRVDTIKLDRLMNLLGEIVIGQSSIARIADTLNEDDSYALRNALHGLDRSTREFQEQIMSIRMIPVGSLFVQFKRFVRDTAHGLGKEINLVIEGNETELDKTVIERIGDPLKHMVRNAIDHGIETKEERVKVGKAESGTVKLNAYHQEGNVFIEVSDDGRGLDYTRIAEKAARLGYIRQDEDVTQERLADFIFMPGFSTAEKVGDLSGRGVGMDVVKTNIESLRGSVEIISEKGNGSIFRIKMPLTLAIIEGMLCRIGSSVYIIPLLSIIESMRPKKEDIHTIENKGEVVFVRGEYVALVRAYHYFGIKGDYLNPWESLVIIVESAGRKLALMIDDLIGQQQIVIKNLDSAMVRKGAISGAAILGDGSVALIIDIHGLMSDISQKTIRLAG
jgi:two-component system, chemotaxis family, sensor kinase CheA